MSGPRDVTATFNTSHRGIGPDLHVVVTASAATSPPVGSELDFFVTVSSKNVGNVSDVRLNLTLPAGYTVTHTYADRGPGCTGAASNLTCEVAWITGGTGTHVQIFGVVGVAGEQDITATVTLSAETELDSSDHTATLKVAPASAPLLPPAAGPPRRTPSPRRPSPAPQSWGMCFTPPRGDGARSRQGRLSLAGLLDEGAVPRSRAQRPRRSRSFERASVGLEETKTSS